MTSIRIFIQYFFNTLWLSLFCLPFAAAITAEQLVYYTEEYPPSNYFDNKNLTGISVETLKLLWQEMNIGEHNINVVPWARGYYNTLNNPNTVLFTMAKTPSRDKLFKWVGPIYYAEHVLLARSDFKEQISDIKQAYKYTIAAIKNDISELTLLEQHFPEENIARISQLKQATLMLKNKRIDLMIINRSSIQRLIEEHNLSKDYFKIVYSVNKVGLYYAFNLNTSDQLINQFQQAFNNTEAQRQIIKNKYQLNY